MYNFCFLFNNYFNQKKKRRYLAILWAKIYFNLSTFSQEKAYNSYTNNVNKRFQSFIGKNIYIYGSNPKKSKDNMFYCEGLRSCFKIAVPLEHAQWRAVLSRHSGSLRLMSIFLLNISSSRVSQSPIEAASCSSNPDVILHLTQVINRVTL